MAKPKARKPKWQDTDAATLRHNVGQRVRCYRDRQSQREFANHIGIEQRYLCKIERGEADLSLSVLQKLSQGIGLPLHKLLDSIETAHKTGYYYGYDGPSSAEWRRQVKEADRAKVEYEAKQQAEWEAELAAKYPGMTLDEAIDKNDEDVDAEIAAVRKRWREEQEREEQARQERKRVSD